MSLQTTAPNLKVTVLEQGRLQVTDHRKAHGLGTVCGRETTAQGTMCTTGPIQVLGAIHQQTNIAKDGTKGRFFFVCLRVENEVE
mmetsp:Transcript_13063/g.15758  ORF Transcript_13063/g.15758 Transcript_13063/m.15758 type:complete len:85 (-) Transcript_13063:474-728(-)|eukprot:CAMPEP_0197861328 /NCGR_PEP_ID=MMETSP1438-20131217/37320_1 /TAXON_ID=1461541 /ORGANISM="Pterosperma sp., Strain CCMP1384" /LENGTH=84 /DNA_ID=CAMNT_0043478467 /DNA_START=496 /DNA_END=750 /DNA_ORIENTATION=-